MKRTIRKSWAALVPLLVAGSVCAAAPLCQTQKLGAHTSKMCVEQTPFKHDYYTLWVDDSPIFMLPDDYVEKVALTHTVPEDGAIEFPLSKQGTPTVTISGGCAPVSETQGKGADAVNLETGRVCSFNWGKGPVVKDLRFSFE
ncbi:hypothetical protein [Burkholderia pseudomallei]|uniref:hypothetical protein n=1 Tax=Burkholderia pseudomallei TaxID=28450 RepID=UPI00051036CB|nr:hypothetical protein [Burkholderia pseudomallei]KGD06445.1 hypothetical protein DO63_3519 [Burkholderia pseudomallei]